MFARIRPFVLSCCLLAAPLAHGENFVLPTFEQVRTTHHASDAWLLDRYGVPLADRRIDPRIRRLDWVPLTSFSPALRNALLRAEDRRFFQHSGVDWLAFASAAWQNLWSEHRRGASTLTMQLAGLLDPALHMPAERRSYSQKWDQSRAALALEAHWSKAQILEAYLNLAPFRGDLQGISAAAELLFDQRADALSASEASILVALLRGPNATPPIVARRACKLAESLGNGRLCPAITRLSAERLDAPRGAPRHALAPHLAQELLHTAGERLVSTLDAGLQRRTLAALRGLGDPGAAALVLDNASGEVLAWVGAPEGSSRDGVNRPRSAPDALWPAFTALALDTQNVTLATPVPLGWAVFDARDGWAASPSWMSLRAATRARQPAALAWLRAQSGVDPVLAARAALPALAGEPEALTLLEFANLWRTVASSGQSRAPRTLGPGANVEAGPRLWSPAAGYLTLDLFAGTVPGLRRPAWSVSAADGSQLTAASSGALTLAIASQRLPPARLLSELLGESAQSPAPEGLVQTLLRFDPPGEPVRREWFIRGTELERVSVLPGGAIARISFPQDQVHYVVAADPGERERWALSAASQRALRWQLDGAPLGEGLRLAWQPEPGPHRLSVHDASGATLDSVEFTVYVQSPSADAP